MSFLSKRVKGRLWFNIILLLILPLFSVLIVLFLVYSYLNLKIQDQGTTKIAVDDNALKPSQLLADKAAFANQEVTLVGRVVKGPAVCQKKECPENDPCCGCPDDRDLIIYDQNTSFSQSAGGKLQLLNTDSKPFCSRAVGSCDYQCGDWQDGGIYQINGTFFYKKPPPGWNSSFEYHFIVGGKKMLGEVDLSKSATNFWQELKQQFKNLTTSGGYVLR